MEEHVYPNEQALDARRTTRPTRSSRELQQEAKDAGLWAPHLPPEAGGSGSGFLEYAYLNEEIGRSFIAQLIFGCQAPDAGNGEILHLFGTDEQKERFLEPLVAGETRSFFGMTEPEVAGSDPTLLRGRAVRDGDEWVINAHKWFSSGADGAAFGDRHGRHRSRRRAAPARVDDPRPDRHARLRARAARPGDGPRGPRLGHALRDALHRRARAAREHARRARRRLPDRAEAARAGRIHHVMRWLGQMQRAFELMCSYSLERKAFGEPLAEKQTIQNWIAESAADIQACRLMTMQAAQRIDEGDEARVEISLIKFFAARVLNDVIDRAIQVHGGLGMTDDTPLALMWRMARGGRIYDGPDEVHKMVVARRILRAFADGDGWRFT